MSSLRSSATCTLDIKNWIIAHVKNILQLESSWSEITEGGVALLTVIRAFPPAVFSLEYTYNFRI